MTPAALRAVVGRISYLNTEPFFEDLVLDAEQVTVPPRELAVRAARGEVDAGALPVAELFRLEASFEPLGEMGIATTGRVSSVLAFSRRPFADLEGARIGLTTESSTSVRLLRLLLEQRLGVRPREYVRGAGRDSDAFLAIGDEALGLAHRPPGGFPHVLDLGDAWHEWQGLPFVFARWAVRRSVPAAEKTALAEALSRGLARGMERAADIAARYESRLGVPAAELESYLRRFTYRLGPQEAAGEKAFRRMLGEHHLAEFDPR